MANLKQYLPIKKKNIPFLLFVLTMIGISVAFHLAFQVYAQHQSVESYYQQRTKALSDNLLAEIRFLGEDILRYQLSCKQISDYLHRARTSKQYIFHNISSNIFSLSWHSEAQSCSANALGFKIQKISNTPSKSIVIKKEPLSGVSTLTLNQLIFNDSNQANGMLSFSASLEDYLNHILANGNNSQNYIKLSAEINDPQWLSLQATLNWETIIQIIILRFFVLSCLFLCCYLLYQAVINFHKSSLCNQAKHLSRKHRTTLLALQKENASLQHRLDSFKLTLSSIKAQRACNKKISNNISKHLSDLTLLFDELYIKKSAHQSLANKMGPQFFEKMVNILSIRTNSSPLVEINFFNLIEQVIMLHQEKAIQHHIQLAFSHNQSPLATIQADELRLTMVLSGILGKLLSVPAEGAIISVEVKATNDNAIITFQETNGFYKKIEDDSTEKKDFGFDDLSKPLWFATKRIASVEGYQLTEQYSSNTGRNIMLSIPKATQHKKENNVLQIQTDY